MSFTPASYANKQIGGQEDCDLNLCFTKVSIVPTTLKLAKQVAFLTELSSWYRFPRNLPREASTSLLLALVNDISHEFQRSRLRSRSWLRCLMMASYSLVLSRTIQLYRFHCKLQVVTHSSASILHESSLWTRRDVPLEPILLYGGWLWNSMTLNKLCFVWYICLELSGKGCRLREVLF